MDVAAQDVVAQFEFRGYATIVYKSVVTQIEDLDRGQGQEGAPRRGGGPRGRPLHHFKAPDGATYVLYMYLACSWTNIGQTLDSEKSKVCPIFVQVQKLSRLMLHMKVPEWIFLCQK